MSDKGIILNGLEMDVREYANLEKKVGSNEISIFSSPANNVF